MDKDNLQRIMKLIKPTDKVLDVGGWEWSFRRANAVIDCKPYVTRGDQGYSDDSLDCFNFNLFGHHFNLWLQQDACATWPIKDKLFDLVITSHILEDVRDPLAICHEMNRVAKSGYIVFPNMITELQRSKDVNVQKYPDHLGFWHHRWLIHYDQTENNLWFFPKLPILMIEPRIQKLEWPYIKYDNVAIYWESRINYTEPIFYELESYIQAILEFNDEAWKKREINE